MSSEPEQHFPSYLRPPMSGVQGQRSPEDHQGFLDFQKQLEKSQGPEKINLTSADKALIKKVNQEHFFSRSVPMSLIAGGAVLFANQKGYITTGKLLR